MKLTKTQIIARIIFKVFVYLMQFAGFIGLFIGVPFTFSADSLSMIIALCIPTLVISIALLKISDNIMNEFYPLFK